MATFETHDGKRFVRLLKIRVPMALALGHYEDLEEDELDDHYDDIVAEYTRRKRPPPSSVRGESREWQDNCG